MSSSTMNCPLCSNQNLHALDLELDREYLKCPVCDLIFAHSQHYLSRDEEFKRYEMHQNDLNDPGYRSFLERLSKPMMERIPANAKGLDFGSGPGPLLKKIFEEQGQQMSHYDSYYTPDLSVFDQQFDFITSSEVVEHLHHPLDELERLWSCLKPGGYLGLMTGLRPAEAEFKRWHYIRDPTHVIFFSQASFRWLANKWIADIEFISDSVIILKKRP